MHLALNEIQRVLKPKGVYVCISHGLPEFRLPELESVNSLFRAYSIGKCTRCLSINPLFVSSMLLGPMTRKGLIFTSFTFAKSKKKNDCIFWINININYQVSWSFYNYTWFLEFCTRFHSSFHRYIIVNGWQFGQ